MRKLSKVILWNKKVVDVYNPGEGYKLKRLKGLLNRKNRRSLYGTKCVEKIFF